MPYKIYHGKYLVRPDTPSFARCVEIEKARGRPNVASLTIGLDRTYQQAYVFWRGTLTQETLEIMIPNSTPYFYQPKKGPRPLGKYECLHHRCSYQVIITPGLKGGVQKGGNKPGLKHQKRKQNKKLRRETLEQKRAKRLPEPVLPLENKVKETKPKPPMFQFCSLFASSECKNPSHYHVAKSERGTGSKPDSKEQKAYQTRKFLKRKQLEKLPCTIGPSCTKHHYCLEHNLEREVEASALEGAETSTATLADTRVQEQEPLIPALPEPVIESNPVQWVLVPRHQVGEHEEKARDYKIHMGMLRELRKRFPNPFLSHAMLNVFLASVNKSHPDTSLTLRVATVQYFTAITYISQQALRDQASSHKLFQSALNKNRETATFEQPSSLDFEDYVLGLGLPMDHGGIRRLYATESTLPQKTGTNHNFLVLSSSGFSPIDPAIPEIGTFATGVNQRARFYKTIFFRFKCSREFQFLDASGDNYVKAMYRLFRHREPKGASPGESQLRTNQMRILNHVEQDPTLLSLCSHEPLIIPQEAGEGTPARAYAAQAVTRFRGEESPAYLETLLLTTLAGLSLVFYKSLYDAYYARGVYTFLGTAYSFGPSISVLIPFLGTLTLLLSFAAVTKKRLYQYWYMRRIHTYSTKEKFPPGEVKFKKEWAKPGKHGRLFVSYGASILTLGWFFGYFKRVFCKTYTYHLIPGLPHKMTIVKCLDEGARPSKYKSAGLCTRHFSDDMELEWHDPLYNTSFDIDIDISGCDAGNTSAPFYLLAQLMMALGITYEMIANTYARLTGPLICHNPSNHKEFIRIQPRTIYQGSGCPETTVVNNVSSALILCSIYYVISQNRELWNLGRDADRTALIEKAAGYVGHQVSVDHRRSAPEKQFLKYSPFTTDLGEEVLSRNKGAIFRSLGSCDGDLLPVHLGLTTASFRKLTLEEKGERWAASIVAGLVNEPADIIMDALRERFPNGKPVILNKHTANQGDRKHFRIPTSELQRRYGGTMDDWVNLARKIRQIRFGQAIQDELIDSFMATDYGVALPTG